MNNLVLVLFVSIVGQVVCETNNDVIESFAQIFETLHKDVSAIQGKTHGSISDINRRFSSTLRNIQFTLTGYQNEARVAVNQQMQETLNYLNLTINNDKVQKCVKDNNDDIEKMIIKSEGGFHVCRNLKVGKIDENNIALSGVYNKEEKVHLDLEGAKILCNSTIGNTAQLRNCLHYQLFVVHINSVQELKEESKQMVKKYDSVFEKAEEKLKSCSNVVHRNIFEEANVITLRFRNCCNEIVPTKN